MPQQYGIESIDAKTERIERDRYKKNGPGCSETAANARKCGVVSDTLTRSRRIRFHSASEYRYYGNMQSYPPINPVDRPVSEASATHKTYLAIQHLIVTGALKPGEKLKIEGLRTRLDTGASPIREALSLLTSDNLVERIDQRGFRVAPTSLSNFEEILELRCDLEDRALRKSIANRTEQWEEHVVLCQHRMTRAKQSADPDFEALHKAFHMALLSRCDAPILLKFCSQLYDLNIRYRYLAGNALDYTLRDVASEHEAIMQSSIFGDADKASELLLAHYRQTGAFLVDALSAAENA